MRVAILGGGVAGVVTASGLARDGNFTVDLFERSPELGGLQRSVFFNGLCYDIGSFLFSPHHELLRAFPALNDTMVMVDSHAKVLTRHGTFDDYPMTMRGYFRDHGLYNVPIEIASILGAKLLHWRRDTLTSYLKYYLGNRIYVNSGLKGYIERLFSTSDRDVDLEFGLQRMGGLPWDCGLRKVIWRTIKQPLTSTNRGRVWRCYARPREGFQKVYEVIGDDLSANGVRVHLNAAVSRVKRNRGTFDLHFEDGRRESYDLVVSTIPIASMLKLIGETQTSSLETLRLVSLCYRFDGSIGFVPANTLYNYSDDGSWKRMQLYSPFYGKANDGEYFVVECTQRNGDGRSPDEFREDFQRHTARYPVFKGELSFQGSTTTDDAYPLLKCNERELKGEARKRLLDYGIAIVGRQGTFVYANAHETALAAGKLVSTIRGRAGIGRSH